MLLLLSVLFIGIFIGFLIRKKKGFEKILDNLIMIAIYALLFLIGISVGGNKQIVENLDKIGINALVLTIGAVIGSILVSYFVYKKLFRK